ncbi:MAG TPA: glutamate racemase [Anaerolineaceae bacterium]|nr:glutamate racemase [Anaerolineaceae bacterium]
MTAGTPLIGVFDSGVGGLSVLREIHALLPAQPVLYFADQGHVPYGSRQIEEVRAFARGITRYLLGQGAQLIVIACNTASVAALKILRDEFPQIPFVGMEPAVKPAAEQSLSRKIGILATEATFQTAMYASVVDRFAHGVTLMEDPCPGLVSQIEKGNLAGKETRAILTRALEPMVNAGVDTIVMGCTHYPFVIPLIHELAGSQLRIIDPAPAVARQVRRVLEANNLLNPGSDVAMVRFVTSGDVAQFQQALHSLIGVEAPVEKAFWQGEEIKNTGGSAV